MEGNIKFLPGQIICHKQYKYRGVIYDVDDACKANEEWYQNNKTQPERNQPWYHVLVDGELQTTYVAEENLELDRDRDPIDHPMIEEIFSKFQNGRYIREYHS
ncbi:MAG: heat shock protein HspQ [bacterium]|nr:heat shock protein HspQ [bacterium]